MDTSALVKRVINEVESDDLVDELAYHVGAGNLLWSSSLAWIESTRALRRQLDRVLPVEIIDSIETALSGVTEYAMTEQVVEVARRIGSSSLRTLDAIHLATATLIGAELVIAYDSRLLESAQELGFRTNSPGTVNST